MIHHRASATTGTLDPSRPATVRPARPTSLRRAVAAVAAALVAVAVAPALTTLDDAAEATPSAGPTTTRPGARSSSTTTVPTRRSSTTAAPTTAPGARAAAQREVDVLRSSRADVRSELDELRRRIDSQSATVLAAHVEAEQATAAAQAASARGAAARSQAAAARDLVRRYAVQAFIRPPAQDSLAVLSVSRAEDATYAQDVLGIMADSREDVVTQMVRVEQLAADEERAASTAASTARVRESDAAQQLDQLEQLRAEQAAVAEQLDDRLDAALSEAAALASVDAAAAAALAEQETALRSQAPGAAARPATGRGGSAGRTTPTVPPARGTPPTTARPVTTARPPATTAPRPPTTVRPPTGLVGWSDMTRVGSIWVHTSIAGRVRGLLDAATAAGFSLAGGGFRDPASQITLRRAHCGPTDYDVYQKPASQCTPPTARPGTSMHERGLAMDLTSSGRLITSRADPAFRWLQANASRFGFFNLPSEPWHWSVNGQ